MADLIRTAKSGNEWTNNELEAYNIHITFQDAQTFFGETPLPAPAVDQDILTAPTHDDATNETAFNVLGLLDLAMPPSDREESAVDDFAVALLHALGYTRRPRTARERKECTIQEDKRFGDGINPHAQLFAEAIAAFQNNNLQTRRRSVGLEICDSKVIPGTIMVGTTPSFFKIPVTNNLSRCVEQGQYPDMSLNSPAPIAGSVKARNLPIIDVPFSNATRLSRNLFFNYRCTWL